MKIIKNSKDKLYKGFLLVKPDGLRYTKKVIKQLKKDKYKISGFYLIKDFLSFSDDIYKISKNEDFNFYEIMHINNIIASKLWGNTAILIIVEKQEESLLSFLRKLDKFKSQIRNIYSLSKQKILHVLINCDELGVDVSCSIKGEVKIVKDNDTLVPYRYPDNHGNFVWIGFYLLHSSDCDNKIYEQEMNYIRNQKLFKIPRFLLGHMTKSYSKML